MSRSLRPDKVLQTIELLRIRIEERFPGAGLGEVVRELGENGHKTQREVTRLARPSVAIRLLVALVLAGVVGLICGIPLLISNMGLEHDPPTFGDVINILEPALGATFFLTAFVVFLTSIERSRKRSRVLSALYEYRAMAHVIDMHQLTKDPQSHFERIPTEHSPERDMTPFELSRYFDYCSEALALISKVASLYAERFPDQVVTTAVDEIEGLTSRLSQKVWQKTMLISAAAASPPTTGP